MKRPRIMIVITILALLVSFGLAYAYRVRIQKEQNKKHGAAFTRRYAVLYNLLTQRRKTEIIRARFNIITVMIRINNDQHLLTLEEADERLSITWKLKSKEYGMLTKEWSFNPRHSQNWMYDEILHDIRAIQLQKIRHLKNAEKIKLRAA